MMAIMREKSMARISRAGVRSLNLSLPRWLVDEVQRLEDEAGPNAIVVGFEIQKENSHYSLYPIMMTRIPTP